MLKCFILIKNEEFDELFILKKYSNVYFYSII